MLFKLAVKNAPVIGADYGFTKTAVEVYKCNTVNEAVCKGVFIDWTPPYIKYSALCAALLVCGTASVATGGNSLMLSATIPVGEAIVESALE